MWKKLLSFRENQQKEFYLLMLFLVILALILVLRMAFLGFSNEGRIFHWTIVVLSLLAGIFVQSFVIPKSKLSGLAFRGLGLILLGIAMFTKSWSLATNPLLILSIFLMTAKVE